MLDEQTENVSATAEPATATDAPRKYERSTIEFPYGSLDDAAQVAAAIYDNAGTKCTLNQLATYLDQSPTSSGLRTRTASARTFGLIEREGSFFALTELGKRAADPRTAAEAKVQAFLQVPLFQAMHHAFDGFALPPAAALERKMQELGVASKQTDRARQVFERSARQAGFLAHGSDRFVQPAFRGDAAAIERTEAQTRRRPAERGNGGGDGRHPFIEGLIKTLPEPESDWAMRDRAKWLQAANQIFHLIYVGEGSIRIEVEDGKD